MNPVSKVQIISPYAALDLAADALAFADPANFNLPASLFDYDPASVLVDELPGLANSSANSRGNIFDDPLPGDDTRPGDDILPGDDTRLGLDNSGSVHDGNEAVTFTSLTQSWVANSGEYLGRLANALRRMGSGGDLEDEYNDLADAYDALAAAFEDAADELEEMLDNLPDEEMTAQQLWDSEWGTALRTLLTELMEDYQELRGRVIDDPSSGMSWSINHLSFWNNRNPFAVPALPGFITGEQTLTESFNALLASGLLTGARRSWDGNGVFTPGGPRSTGGNGGGGNGIFTPGGGLSTGGGDEGGDGPGAGSGAFQPAPANRAAANLFDVKPANDDADPFQYLGETDPVYDWLGDILGAGSGGDETDEGPYDLADIMRAALGDSVPLDDWLSPLLPPDGLAAISYNGMDPNGAMPSIFSVGGTQFST